MLQGWISSPASAPGGVRLSGVKRSSPEEPQGQLMDVWRGLQRAEVCSAPQLTTCRASAIRTGGEWTASAVAAALNTAGLRRAVCTYHVQTALVCACLHFPPPPVAAWLDMTCAYVMAPKVAACLDQEELLLVQHYQGLSASYRRVIAVMALCELLQVDRRGITLAIDGDGRGGTAQPQQRAELAKLDQLTQTIMFDNSAGSAHRSNPVLLAVPDAAAHGLMLPLDTLPPLSTAFARTVRTAAVFMHGTGFGSSLCRSLQLMVLRLSGLAHFPVPPPLPAPHPAPADRPFCLFPHRVAWLQWSAARAWQLLVRKAIIAAQDQRHPGVVKRVLASVLHKPLTAAAGGDGGGGAGQVVSPAHSSSTPKRAHPHRRSGSYHSAYIWRRRNCEAAPAGPGEHYCGASHTAVVSGSSGSGAGVLPACGCVAWGPQPVPLALEKKPRRYHERGHAQATEVPVTGSFHYTLPYGDPAARPLPAVVDDTSSAAAAASATASEALPAEEVAREWVQRHSNPVVLYAAGVLEAARYLAGHGTRLLLEGRDVGAGAGAGAGARAGISSFDSDSSLAGSNWTLEILQADRAALHLPAAVSRHDSGSGSGADAAEHQPPAPILQRRPEDDIANNPAAALLDAARLAWFVLQLPSAPPQRLHRSELPANPVLPGTTFLLPAEGAGTLHLRSTAWQLLVTVCAGAGAGGDMVRYLCEEALRDPSVYEGSKVRMDMLTKLGKLTAAAEAAASRNAVTQTLASSQDDAATQVPSAAPNVQFGPTPDRFRDRNSSGPQEAMLLAPLFPGSVSTIAQASSEAVYMGDLGIRNDGAVSTAAFAATAATAAETQHLAGGSAFSAGMHRALTAPEQRDHDDYRLAGIGQAQLDAEMSSSMEELLQSFEAVEEGAGDADDYDADVQAGDTEEGRSGALFGHRRGRGRLYFTGTDGYPAIVERAVAQHVSGSGTGTSSTATGASAGPPPPGSVLQMKPGDATDMDVTHGAIIGEASTLTKFVPAELLTEGLHVPFQLPASLLRPAHVFVQDSGLAFITPPTSDFSWRACHTENTVWSHIFAVLFWDTLTAAHCRWAWKTPWRLQPADFGDADRSDATTSKLQARLMQLARLTPCELAAEYCACAAAHRDGQLLRLRWDLFDSRDIAEMLHAAGAATVAAVLRRLVENYHSAFSGLPDISAWRPRPCSGCSLSCRGWVPSPHCRVTVHARWFRVTQHAPTSSGGASSASASGPALFDADAARLESSLVQRAMAVAASATVPPAFALLEVKSHKDKLQPHQLRWFQYFDTRVPAYVVHVAPPT